MSNYVAPDPARLALDQAEADNVISRLSSLVLSPLPGRFDADHLKALHAYIFQDAPRHHPGEIRPNTDNWIKSRALEGSDTTYRVPYLGSGVEDRITAILADFGGVNALKGQTLETASAKLATLYGDLDYAHGFREGNSRTLREFTRMLADEAGFTLDWTPTAVTANTRNYLYVARDIEVISRAYPGMTSANARNAEDHLTLSQAEHFRKQIGAHALERLIKGRLSIASAQAIAEAKTPTALVQGPWSSKSYFSDLASKASSPTSSSDLTNSESLKKPLGYRAK